MTLDQLKEVMKYHLGNFNDENVEINDQTVHNTVLRDQDGFGNATSRRIYKAFIRWTLKKAGLKDKAWPDGWMNMDVLTLAAKLIGTGR